jgi:hypothetical protein
LIPLRPAGEPKISAGSAACTPSRVRDIAEGVAKPPQLTTSYTGIAMTQKLRRIIDEGVTLGLALEGISAADVARGRTK